MTSNVFEVIALFIKNNSLRKVMEEKYIMVSMEDERSRHLADVLGNKTCKKVIELLTEKEMSEAEIANSLGIPMNTIEYNLKKLVAAGLIEQTKNIFWSIKGKKIPTYKISNKYIVISPKKKFRAVGLFATLVVSGIAAAGIRYYELITKTSQVRLESAQPMLEAGKVAAFNIPASGSIALWFLGGALFSLVIYLAISAVRGSN